MVRSYQQKQQHTVSNENRLCQSDEFLEEKCGLFDFSSINQLEDIKIARISLLKVFFIDIKGTLVLLLRDGIPNLVSGWVGLGRVARRRVGMLPYTLKVHFNPFL